MSMRKNSNRWTFFLAFVVIVLAAFTTTGVKAIDFQTTPGCKDLMNDGIEFSASVSIPAPASEKWRGSVVVDVWSPDQTVGDGVPWSESSSSLPANDSVTSLVVYSATENKAYECTQLHTDNALNSFSCNSLPTGATINRISVRFRVKFDTSTPPKLIDGNYTVQVNDLMVSPSVLLAEGKAKVDTFPNACAWNQHLSSFTDPNGSGEVLYDTCPTPASPDSQILVFNESSEKPFTIVSFPYAENLQANRFKMIVEPKNDLFDYTLRLRFLDADGVVLWAQYVLNAGENPTVKSALLDAATWEAARLPIKLVGGNIAIDRGGIVPSLLPKRADFSITLYYENVDPKLGFENSLFHFKRDLTVLFAPQCTGVAQQYKVSPLAFDPCLASKQVFPISFIDDTGFGYAINTAPKPLAEDSSESLDIPYLLNGKGSRNMYMCMHKCANADCSTVEATDAYAYRVEVRDGDHDNRGWHYYSFSKGCTLIPFRVENNKRSLLVNTVFVTAKSAGTYRVRGFIPSKSSSSQAFDETRNAMMTFYVTIPEKPGSETCKSAGTGGIYKAGWDMCKEAHDPQLREFKVLVEQKKEKVAFVDNRSNKTITYQFDPGSSKLDSPADLKELWCDWSTLASGYTTSGAVCSPSKIVLPPFTRAVIKGGKINLLKKPNFVVKDDDYEFVMSYRRFDTGSNMRLYIKMHEIACPVEKIPETGYSLRSPAPSVAEQTSDIVFTGNSLQIPAIGLGMETPIPIVHVGYIGDEFKNGWNLKMLGGYVGELEGGAYLPYPGNSVLTGHYYSQGVFVNLSGLKLEDEIIVFGNDDVKYTYKVTNSYWTTDTDPYQMFQPNGERSLTLVTCDKYNFVTDTYEKRYIVQATLDRSESMLP